MIAGAKEQWQQQPWLGRIRQWYRPFRPAAVKALVLTDITTGFVSYTIQGLGIVVYTDGLGCSTVEAGRAIALTNLARFGGSWLGAAIETSLLRAGVRLRRTREHC